MQGEINCVAVIEKPKPVLVKVIMSCPQKVAMTQESLRMLPRQDNGEDRDYFNHHSVVMQYSHGLPKVKRMHKMFGCESIQILTMYVLC